MRDIRIGAAQFEAKDADKTYNLSRVDDLTAQAVAAGAEVVSPSTSAAYPATRSFKSSLESGCSDWPSPFPTVHRHRRSSAFHVNTGCP